MNLFVTDLLTGLLNSLRLRFLLLLLLALPPLRAAAELKLRWQAETGLTWRTPQAEVTPDRADQGRAITLRFLPDGPELPLASPTAQQQDGSSVRLRYELSGPGKVRLVITRSLRARETEKGAELVEEFSLSASAPITQDLEIIRPFRFSTIQQASTKTGALPSVLLPLKNGWAKSMPASEAGQAAEYRLGNWIGDNAMPELALPVVELSASNAWQAVVCADPRFSALFDVRTAGGDLRGEVRYRYAGSRVPIQNEARQFGFWVGPAPAAGEPFGASMDAFFRMMLSATPAGPQWLHGISMVGYDFLSDDGLGWERDVSLLTSWLEPAERRHVALCLHGWYDALGEYSFDEARGRLKDEWVAMARTRKVRFTPDELRRRLRFAHERGFRVLLYFADGMAADSGTPGYQDAWAWRDEKGAKVTGWQGPDTFGTTYMMDPSHPKVQERFLRYLDALLQGVGRDVDGFVWDETFHVRAGQIGSQAGPAYCDRAMMDLVKALTERVHRFDPEKVFLASDCVGIAPNIPGYAMMADGLYQDTHCNPARWPEALFPNWRNTYWSCNWGPRSHFDWTRYGVEQFGVPVAISNGWGDDHGPSEWSEAERDEVLKLFRARLAKGPVHVRSLSVDPATLAKKAPPH